MPKSKSNDVHVTKRDDGWAVKSNDAQRAAKIADTQMQAIEKGKEIAQNRGVDLVVHGKNGQIRSKDSYGNDPNPPKDTEN